MLRLRQGYQNMTELKRVLVVDDEESVLFVLRGALAKLGEDYQVHVHRARNGEEALLKAQVADLDLLITDIRLPGIDGVQLTEQIKGLQPEIGIVWITAYGCQKLRREASRLGVYKCLDKPLEIAEIRQAAREALDDASHEMGEGKQLERNSWK
ncbi:MAG TPA: response regulator [Chloroflexi bacterium]|nr:response regulator [Chloroflexota bacterium]